MSLEVMENIEVLYNSTGKKVKEYVTSYKLQYFVKKMTKQLHIDN